MLHEADAEAHLQLTPTTQAWLGGSTGATIARCLREVLLEEHPKGTGEPRVQGGVVLVPWSPGPDARFLVDITEDTIRDEYPSLYARMGPVFAEVAVTAAAPRSQ